MSKRAEPVLTPEEVRLLTERREAEAAFRSVLLTREGRLAVSWLLRTACGVFDETYVPGGVEAARHTEFNLGRRAVGLDVIQVAGIRLDGLREFEEHERQGETAGRNRVKERTERRRSRRQGRGEE